MIVLAAAALRAGPPEPERVLEVECGAGEGTLFLAREFPRARVRGVDAAPESVAAAGARIGLDPEGRVAFKQGGRRRLPFPDSHFDLVVQTRGRPSPGELARVMRPGGRLLLVRADRPPGDRPGPRDRWSERRLARAGFERLERGEAGGGSFFVMRLRDPVSRSRSD
jgi:ubiquinone/menaquinone biosynthesis C-methylase UbiE